MLFLDYLRFLAIFGVIAFHLHDTVAYATPWFSGGYLGVDIFLFLSGYFIERSLSGIRDQELLPAGRYFFSRRLLRIMIPMLFVTAVVGGFSYSQNMPLWKDMLYSSLFIYNFYLVFHHIPYFQVYSAP
ncbi:acyltransferase, partial [Acidithiobacillus caldus]